MLCSCAPNVQVYSSLLAPRVNENLINYNVENNDD